MIKAKNWYFPVCLFLAIGAHAQVIEVPLPQPVNTQFRIMNDTIPIGLPFWDDFSASYRTVDTSLWVQSNAVFVNPGIGRNPPTLNVATLDGWDIFGKPYSQDKTIAGPIDSLTSRPILLGQVPESKHSTLFLSFFYQFEGNGEKPNPFDSLTLSFKNAEGEWNIVWPASSDDLLRQPNVFNQVYIPVTEEYISDAFQFKFNAYGRLSGPFDTWNLDYIYLDKNRSASDGIDYLDRAFREVPGSIIYPYTAMPLDHFLRDDPSVFMDSTSVGFINLEQNVQPVEYTVEVRDQLSGQLIDNLVKDSAFLALRYPVGLQELKAGPLDPSKLDQTADSIYLRTRFIMDSGDKFLIDSVYNNGLDTAFTDIDLRVNDTTFVETVFNDYYAYDDGTAEFGAGINQLNGSIAVQFIPAGPGILGSIDISFQNIGEIVTGVPIDIFVLRNLDPDDDLSVIGSLSTTVIVPPDINGFITYNFSQPVVVLDTFYVGYQQFSNQFVAVGLDKNTNNADKLFYNITGDWLPQSDVEGSLLIRPRYTYELVTAVDEPEPATALYPNPTSGIVYLATIPENIRLFNIKGQELPVKHESNRVDLTGNPPAVYFLMLQYKGQWEQHKIALKP